MKKYRVIVFVVISTLIMNLSCVIILAKSGYTQPQPYYVRNQQGHGGPVWKVHGPAPLNFQLFLNLGFNLRGYPLISQRAGSVLVLDSAIPPEDADYQSFIDGRHWMGVQPHPSYSPSIGQQEIVVFRVGFPFPAFQYRVDLDLDQTRMKLLNRKFIGAYGIPMRYLGFLRAKDIVIPYQPYWPGFFYNLLVWSGLVWVAKRLVLDRIKLARKKKRAKRRKLVQCLECGYPIGDLSRCPECGADAESRIVEGA